MVELTSKYHHKTWPSRERLKLKGRLKALDRFFLQSQASLTASSLFWDGVEPYHYDIISQTLRFPQKNGCTRIYDHWNCEIELIINHGDWCVCFFSEPGTGNPHICFIRVTTSWWTEGWAELWLYPPPAKWETKELLFANLVKLGG